MNDVKHAARAGSLAATLVVLIAGVAGPAHAADDPTPLTVKKPDGTWKARANYDEARNRFCVRVYNGTTSSFAKLTVWWPRYSNYITDLGGDTDPNCFNLAEFNGTWAEDELFSWKLEWTGSGDGSGTDTGFGHI